MENSQTGRGGEGPRADRTKEHRSADPKQICDVSSARVVRHDGSCMGDQADEFISRKPIESVNDIGLTQHRFEFRCFFLCQFATKPGQDEAGIRKTSKQGTKISKRPILPSRGRCQANDHRSGKIRTSIAAQIFRDREIELSPKYLATRSRFAYSFS